MGKQEDHGNIQQLMRIMKRSASWEVHNSDTGKYPIL